MVVSMTLDVRPQLFFLGHQPSHEGPCPRHSQMFEHLLNRPIPTPYNSSALYSLTDHGVKLHDVPDEYLVDTLTIAKKIAIAQGAENYNILQVWSYSLVLCHYGTFLTDCLTTQQR
jgi:hypothetical protein